jgi:hypothetical protein
VYDGTLDNHQHANAHSLLNAIVFIISRMNGISLQKLKQTEQEASTLLPIYLFCGQAVADKG